MAKEEHARASLLCSRGRNRLPARTWVLGVVAMSLLSLRPGHSFHSCQILKSLGNVCGKVHASSSMRRLALRTQGGFAGRSTGGSRAAGGALTWTCAAVTAEEGAGAGAEPPTGKLDGPEEAFLDGEGMVLSEADEREAIAQARPLVPLTPAPPLASQLPRVWEDARGPA